MTGEGAPPASETRHRPVSAVPKRITPSRFHAPARSIALIAGPGRTGRSHTVCGGPPEISTFFSLPCNENPRKRLSGDQKLAFTIAFRSGQRLRLERIQRADPQLSAAVRSSQLEGHLPAVGDTLADSLPPKKLLSGGKIWKRTTSAAGGFSRKCTKAKTDATTSQAPPQTMAAIIPHPRPRRTEVRRPHPPAAATHRRYRAAAAWDPSPGSS